MSINWQNVFTWTRALGLGVTGAAGAITKLPAAGVPVSPHVIMGATAIAAFGASVAGISHLALEKQNPNTWPQTALMVAQAAAPDKVAQAAAVVDTAVAVKDAVAPITEIKP